MSCKINARKVVIIGNGAVGSTLAYTLMMGHAVNEISIVDVNKSKVEGDVLDMGDGMSFVSPKTIKAGDYDDCEDAHIIVITAGAGQKPGETRMDLLKKNAAIMNSVCDNIKPHLNPETIVVIVSNPCDVLTYLAYKKLGLPSRQIFGSGTVLDTSRMKTAISDILHIDPRNVHTFVVGEHGDSEVAAWSTTSIAGLSLIDYCSRYGRSEQFSAANLHALHDNVRNKAYEIIAKKGATFYAVALAVSKILNVILNDENHVLTVSTYIENEFNGNLKDVFLSLPCVVGSRGVEYIIHPNYTSTEQLDIIASGNSIKEKIAECMSE